MGFGGRESGFDGAFLYLVMREWISYLDSSGRGRNLDTLIALTGSKDEMANGSRNRRIPRGTGMAIGLALGVLIGLVLDNGAMGLLLGVACGSGFEAELERRRKMKDGSNQD